MSKRTERVENLRGRGNVIIAPGRTCAVDYVVNRFQNYHYDTPTLQSTSGRLGSLSREEWMLLIGRTKPLELVMSDGRRLNIVLRNDKGDFDGTGPIMPAGKTGLKGE